jgi:hypothetical protein
VLRSFTAVRTLHFKLSSTGHIRAVPTIDLPDDELAAVTAAIRRATEDDRFPHARALIRCARRWRGSTRPQSERPCRQPKADKRARR